MTTYRLGAPCSSGRHGAGRIGVDRWSSPRWRVAVASWLELLFAPRRRHVGAGQPAVAAPLPRGRWYRRPRTPWVASSRLPPGSQRPDSVAGLVLDTVPRRWRLPWTMRVAHLHGVPRARGRAAACAHAVGRPVGRGRARDAACAADMSRVPSDIIVTSTSNGT